MRLSVTLSILTLIIIVSCKKDPKKCCSCLEEKGISDEYVFPLKPGMEEWANLKSHQEMVNVCQIPNNILEDICTSGLVETYLNYPLLFTIFAFENINEGFEQVSNDFNGFHEFLQRSDCSTKFLLKYESINPSDLDSSWTTLERGTFKQLLQFFELTLGYGPIRQKLTPNERQQLIQIGLEKLFTKEQDGYSWFSRVTNLYVISTTLLEDGYEPFQDYIKKRPDLQLFVNGYLIDLNFPADGDTIKNLTTSYLKQFK